MNDQIKKNRVIEFKAKPRCITTLERDPNDPYLHSQTWDVFGAGGEWTECPVHPNGHYAIQNCTEYTVSLAKSKNMNTDWVKYIISLAKSKNIDTSFSDVFEADIVIMNKDCKEVRMGPLTEGMAYLFIERKLFQNAELAEKLFNNPLTSIDLSTLAEQYWKTHNPKCK